jgi:hypothetical protein
MRSGKDVHHIPVKLVQQQSERSLLRVRNFTDSTGIVRGLMFIYLLIGLKLLVVEVCLGF